MIFVFEDKKNDLLSVLFRYAYSESDFVYAEGNGNLVSLAEKYLDSTDDIITVFLDTIPDNKVTADIYNDLRRLSLRNNLRVLVLPIVCAEYYFIRTLPKCYTGSISAMGVCLNKEYWRNCNFVSSDDKKFVKNFEKFCKLFLKKDIIDCIRTSRGKDNDNKLYGFYYLKDCLCDCSSNICNEISLRNKAIKFVSQYPIFPKENFLGCLSCFGSCDIKRLWLIHRKLVDEYNNFVEKYRKIDNSFSYKTIRYINIDRAEKDHYNRNNN